MGNFKINRPRQYKWFFEFIWWCIRDICTEPIGFFKYKIAQENWGDFNTRLYFDTDPEIRELERDFKEWNDKHDKDN
jgi:hypothetical protein